MKSTIVITMIRLRHELLEPPELDDPEDPEELDFCAWSLIEGNLSQSL